MRLPRTAAAAVLAVGIMVPAVSGTAVALASPSSHGAVAAAKAGHKPVESGKPGKPHKPRKPVRVPFAANGKVTAVDAEAGTVTLLANGGTKDVRRKTVTVTVPERAKIRVNGKRATVAGILAGARITVTGIRVGDVYTAVVISATRPKPAPTKSPVTPSPSVTPSTDVSPSPSVTPSTDVSPSPTGSATPTPSVSPSADPDEL
ncbi:hypothetical protein ACIBSW_34065 [Actinoplanes sp. NPDC049668]|uniref:hypothetical protein n=1 Tax=unclassified Actinoplanes TaxID=2626549 RepID=UPI0033B85169